MGSFLKVVFLAVIQGIAEFLPISSSGHLVLAKHLVHLDSPGILLEIILHAGTLLSIFIFYHKKIISIIGEIFTGKGEGRSYLVWVIVSMIPAILCFVFLEDKIETAFNNSTWVGIMLCVTGGVLLSLKFADKGKSDLSVTKAILIGIAQAFAMIPGVSRSGSTIAAARHMKIQPTKAAEFSFLMSIPVLLGATIFGIKEIVDQGMPGSLTLTSLISGFFISAAVGLISMVILVKLLNANKFWYFGIYCLCIGILTIFLTIF